MKTFLFLLSIPFLIAFDIQANSCKQSSNSFKNLEYIDNYDGDTITFNIPCVHPLLGSFIKVRLSGIDTAEIRGSRPCEKKVAHYTKNLVASLLTSAHEIKLTNFQRGKYFRIVGDIFFDEKNLSELLLEKNLAITYNGRTKTNYDWCSLKLFQ